MPKSQKTHRSMANRAIRLRKWAWVFRIAAIVTILVGLGTIFSFFLTRKVEYNGPDELSPSERERVLIAQSVGELRSKNDVRPLRYEEQSADLRRLSGIYGFTLASFFENNLRVRRKAMLNTITLQNEPGRYRGAIEVHKTAEGRVMIVGYVDEGTVARVADISKPVGLLYLYHEPQREGQVPIAIPASRIIDWDYRAPHEFSEVEVD